MGELIAGDDGLPVEEVGDWVDEKHRVLKGYLRYHGATRKGYSTRRNVYIDAFCGPGRAKVRDTDRYVDGSPIVSWLASCEAGAPFSAVYIADENDERRALCAERLRRHKAPVIEVPGNAVAAAKVIIPQLDPEGLHFAFVDPYSLGELRQFDAFAPGWQSHVSPGLTREDQRAAVFQYWKTLVDKLGMAASAELKQIRNKQNRDLYWLMLIARHKLGQKFWKLVLEYEPQRGFGF